jgi:hypothetical protein
LVGALETGFPTVDARTGAGCRQSSLLARQAVAVILTGSVRTSSQPRGPEQDVNIVDSVTGHQTTWKTWEPAWFAARFQAVERCLHKPDAWPLRVLGGMIQATISNDLRTEVRTWRHNLPQAGVNG